MSCKVYLVPEDVINSWRADQREKAIDHPIANVVNQTDAKMTDILEQKISDYDKEKLFNQELSKFATLRENPSPPVSNRNFDDMLTSFPKMYRNKAAGLMQYLKSDQDIHWDDQGHLYIGQQKLQDSHIIDLIHDAMRLRKKVPRPRGWRELSKHLIKSNAPKELMGNPDWKDPEWYTPPSSPHKKEAKPSYKKDVKPLKKHKEDPVLKPHSRKAKTDAAAKVKKWISL